MGLSLYLLGIILTLFVLFAVLIARSDESKTYENIDIENGIVLNVAFMFKLVMSAFIVIRKKIKLLINNYNLD